MSDLENRPSDAEIAAEAEAHNQKVDTDYKALMETWQGFEEPNQTQQETQQFAQEPPTDGAASLDNSAAPSDVDEVDSAPSVNTPPEAITTIPTDQPIEAVVDPGQVGVAATNVLKATSPIVAEAGSVQVDLAPTPKLPEQPAPPKPGFLQRIFGVGMPKVEPLPQSPDLATSQVVNPEPTAAVAPAIPAPEATSVTPETPAIDGQAILTKLQELLSSGSYDQLIGDEVLKQAIITANTASITSADSLPNLRVSLSADINRRLSETGKFKSRQDQLYLAGKVNQLMNSLLGADSDNGSIILSDGRALESGSAEYKKRAGERVSELKQQKKEVARRESKTPTERLREAATKGSITGADLAPQLSQEAEVTDTAAITEAQESPNPVTVEATPTADAAPTVEAATDQTEEEKDYARMKVLTQEITELDATLKFPLTAEQLQLISESTYLLYEKYHGISNETIDDLYDSFDRISLNLDTIINLNNFSYDEKASQLRDLMKAMFGSFSAGTKDVWDKPETQELVNQKIIERLGERPAGESLSSDNATVAVEADADAVIDAQPLSTDTDTTGQELTAEQRAEKFTKVAEIAAVFDQGVKDQFKGLTTEQIAQFAIFEKLQKELGVLDDLTEEENNALIDAEEKAKVAFAHHLAYLKADPTISREVRIQKYTDFQKIMDPESWEAQQQTEEGRAQWEAEVAASFPVEKKSKEKRKKIDWRKQAIEASGVAFQEQVGQKAEANKQVIIDGVLTTLDRAATLAAQVGTVPDRVGRVVDVTVTKAINLGNGIGIAADGSVNFLGTVGEIYYGVITAMPAAAKTLGAEAFLKTGQFGEKVNTAMETGVQKGVDAIKQQIERLKERVRQGAEKNEAARQVRITELKGQANSLNLEAEKFRAEAAQAKGLRGWLNRLANQ